tara:strand:+ start:4110 stop:4736 length:627 start_codon:yes stop_codon:yes gene_type:complete
MKYKYFPREFMQLNTNNFSPSEHFSIPLRWDHFTIHIPTWKEVLDYFASRKIDILELGTGNGLCSNWLLDNYDCNVDTVDIRESHEFSERLDGEGQDDNTYIVSALKNLEPYINDKRCRFFHKTTEKFFEEDVKDKKYDMIYIDANHDPADVFIDGVNSFKYLNSSGLIIFDDYGWGDCGKGIDKFLKKYSSEIDIIIKGYQVFIQKK